MAAIALRDFERNLNQSMPSTRDARLGTWIYEMSAQLTALTAQHQALLVKLDAANLALMGTNNAATLGVSIGNILPENRN